MSQTQKNENNNIVKPEVIFRFNRDAKPFNLVGYCCDAYIQRVYDGDTVFAVFEFPGTKLQFSWKIRLYGIDTPEIRSRNLQEKQLGLAAKEFVVNLISEKIVQIECLDFDKYGRVLAKIMTPCGHDLTKLLLQENHGCEYYGGAKTPR